MEPYGQTVGGEYRSRSRKGAGSGTEGMEDRFRLRTKSEPFSGGNIPHRGQLCQAGFGVPTALARPAEGLTSRWPGVSLLVQKGTLWLLGSEVDKTMALSTESGDGFILSRLEKYGVQVKYRAGAPPEPSRQSADFLDHLDKYALEVGLGHPEAPRIVREGDRFVFDRPERKRARYTSIRKALKKLVFELAMKDHGQSG